MQSDSPKSGSLSDAASVGVDQLINVVDNTTKQVVVAASDLKDVAAAVAVAPINIGSKTADAALDEIEQVRVHLMHLLRDFKDGIASVL